MALPEEVIVAGTAGHISAHESLHAVHNQDFNVLDPQYYASGQQPGNGNATHDMTAITNVLADVMSGTSNTNLKQKRVIFPGGRNWRINGSGVDWPDGVHKIGGPGSGTFRSRPTTFHWDGTAGGTMFNLTCEGGGRVNSTLVDNFVYREGTARPGKWWELGDETTVGFSGIDFGTRFRNIEFYNADAPSGAGCFDIRFGPTNFHMGPFRMDNWTGAAIRVAINNAASHVTFGGPGSTMDNGTSGGGFPFWLDNTGMGSNKSVLFRVHDLKFENNVVMTGEKAIILCSLDHLATVGVQCHIELESFHVIPGGGGTDYSVVGARRTDAANTRNISVHAYNTVLPNCRLIDGVDDPPSYGSFVGRRPNWSYTPQGHGHANPGGEATIDDHVTQVRVRDLFVGGGPLTDIMGTNLGRGAVHVHNALAAPSANPTAGGILYVEAGALKYRGSSGTVTTIANA